MKSPTPVEVAVLALWRTKPSSGVEILCARRHVDAIRGGLWELPGGKVDPAESPHSAALRELHEETGLTQGDLVMHSLREVGMAEHTDHALSDECSVRLHVFMAHARSDCQPSAIASAEVRWIPLDEFARYDWPGANVKVNALLLAALAKHA